MFIIRRFLLYIVSTDKGTCYETNIQVTQLNILFCLTIQKQKSETCVLVMIQINYCFLYYSQMESFIE